ncbi:sulfatase-like hydrolase/transferase [Hydrogenophaga sp. SL48]|uniref:sulfatase-like hydrolase/transferase n=1 Tax=Hydrogenophaga sp. SL48 TaxID=2806347 RepID=UPI001F400C5E|nr:sulfatase-like hydrolase/transferase [Hydrogenophaga sp. SL48]UJW80185.1 hypothetical protein IM738_20330 [Hydrogenophaga sp. SL48]
MIEPTPKVEGLTGDRHGHWVFALIGFVVFSLVFQWASLHFGFKRYLLSAEMLMAMLLFVMGLRWLGVALFLVTAGLEMALGAITVFRLIDIGQVLDIAEYLFEARVSYLMMLVLLLVFAATSFWIAANRLKGARWAWLPLIASVLMLAQWQLSFAKATFFSPPFAERNELLFGSSALFVHAVLEENRRRHVHIGANSEDAEYMPVAHPSAASLTLGEQPTSPRILFIIAESWGVSKEQAVIKQQISALSASVHVQNLRLGSIDAVGTTAAGELRELCGRIPTRLNFRQMTAEAIGECMPAKLAKQGYKTVALHGAFGAMYRRKLWYPVIGFSDLVFRETLPFTGTQCHSFPGYCDRDLLGVVRQKLNQDKVLLYWLTLNSHIPYDRRDAVNYREDLCRAVFGATYSEQLCGYQNLHVQFFEHLAKLAEDETMRGVEVVVVGDHAPIFNDSAARARFEQEQVPTLHFVVQ